MKTTFFLSTVMLAILLAANPLPPAASTPVLPTVTPRSNLGNKDPRAKQFIQAMVDDYAVGYLTLMKGETAYLDLQNQVIYIIDAQERLRVELISNNLYRFYIYEDGYDVGVGSGKMLLKAGNNYTQHLTSGNWDAETVEVRRTDTDQLLGYALLTKIYDANNRFTGYKQPAAGVDTDGDGLLGPQELDAALTGLRDTATLIQKSDPTLAYQLTSNIASAESALKSREIASAYHLIKQSQDISAVAAQTARSQPVSNQAPDQISWLLIGLVFMALGLFILTVDVLLRRRKMIASREALIQHKQLAVRRTFVAEPPRLDTPLAGKFCPQCGFQAQPADRFCMQCGNKLESGSGTQK